MFKYLPHHPSFSPLSIPATFLFRNNLRYRVKHRSHHHHHHNQARRHPSQLPPPRKKRIIVRKEDEETTTARVAITTVVESSGHSTPEPEEFPMNNIPDEDSLHLKIDRNGSPV